MHPPQRASGLITELAEVVRTEVRQLVMLPIGPDVLHRIEFRRVGGQVLKIDPASLTGDKLPHQPAAMGLRTIPDHQQLARQVAQQMAQEVVASSSRSSARPLGRWQLQPSWRRMRQT